MLPGGPLHALTSRTSSASDPSRTSGDNDPDSGTAPLDAEELDGSEASRTALAALPIKKTPIARPTPVVYVLLHVPAPWRGL